MLEDPEVGWIEWTGYPSWMQEDTASDDNEDAIFEERREERAWGD